MNDRKFGRNRSLRGILTVAIASAAAANLAGCANPQMPKPPSLHLPKLAEGLTADRVGDEVKLSWKVATISTDGVKMKGPITAVVCREDAPLPPGKAKPKAAPAAHSTPCTPVDRKPVAPGPALAVETLNGINTTDPAHLIAFRIELQNDKGKSAGPSAEVLVAAGASPGPVAGLTVSSAREGAVLRWQGQSQDPKLSAVELHRFVVQPAPKPVKAAKPAASKQAPPPPPKPASAKPKAPRAADTGEIFAGEDRADAGGLVDSTVERLARYRYTAQRVRHVTLAGQELTIFGPESAPVELTYRDTFPPTSVAGLVAIPGDGSVDLSWESGSDPDIAGYNLYRRDRSGAVKKLTNEPEPAPAFRDMTVQPGIPYTYWVTAIDETGNESKPSSEIPGMLPVREP